MESFIKALSSILTPDYRTRLAERNPRYEESMREWAEVILKNSGTLTPEQQVEYTRNEQPLLLPSLEGMLNALEHFSKGAIASRPTGPDPVNTAGAFLHWLMDNPDVEERFRASDIFQELCDSGMPGFEWPEDKEENGPNPIEPLHPGNYL